MANLGMDLAKNKKELRKQEEQKYAQVCCIR